MPVLTLDVGGPDEMDLDCQRGGHAAPRKVGGDRGYSASGSEWPQSRAELMVVPFVTVPLPWSQIATIRGLFALAKRVNCAGDVFNRAGTIVCSGSITDELDATGDRGILNGTLFEVGSTLTYTPLVSRFILTGVVSPDGGGDPDIFVTTPDGSYPGDVADSFDIMPGYSPPTCGVSPNPFIDCATIYSTTPERSWLSVPLAAAVVGGPLTVTVLSNGPAGDTWAHSSFKALIYLVRGGVDVAGPFETSYVGGSLFGGDAITSTPAVGLVLQDGDRFRVEFWGRLALHSGYADDSDRMTIFHGDGGGWLDVGGIVTSL